MITIRKLVKSYNGHTILNGFDLDIKQGKKTTIIGSSGCGKSTLLRLILGLECYQGGDIWIDNVNLYTATEEEKNQLRLKFGMVFQSSALFDSMTVGENVGLVLQEHRKMPASQIRKKVLEKLAMVGLADTYDLYPSALSGGMKKRVAFARAIIHDPEIILFDEPTTGLDPVTSTTIENLINHLTDSINATSVVVTHQLSTILNTSERIYMVHEGKSIRTESPKKIMKSKNPVVYRFVNGLVD